MKQKIGAAFVILFPYMVLFVLYALFFDGPFFNGSIARILFHDSIPFALKFLRVIWLFSLAGAIACIDHSKRADTTDLSKLTMVIKLAQIPAYPFIFACDVAIAYFLSIVVLPMSREMLLALFILDCASIIPGALIGVAAVRQCRNAQILTKKGVIFYSVLQFIFCVDVIASIILFRKARKANNQELAS